MKTIFLDRDGVINVEKDYLYKIEDFEFIPYVIDACKYFQDIGYQLVIITNQSGIGRGYYTQKDFDRLTSWMIDEFKLHSIDIAGVYFCPHGPNDGCDCRKPLTGMIDSAKKDLTIDMQNSWLIGDKNSDIQCAINAGIPNTIQVKTGHSFDEKSSKATFVLDDLKNIKKVIK
jgi:D-glycero-D-manno-heptose 1,7-bisphosphate phosphatase